MENNNLHYSALPGQINTDNTIVTTVQPQFLALPTVRIEPAVRVGPDAVRMICPSCRADIETTRRYKSTASTHIVALLLCAFCCCLLPYCCTSCRQVNHFCPLCNVFIGSHN